MPRQLSASEYTKPSAYGPRMQYVPAALIASLQGAGTVSTGTPFVTPLFDADGYYDFIIGVTSSAAGTLTFQAFIDDAGTVAAFATQPSMTLSAAATILVVNCGSAGTPAVTTPNYTPFASFNIKVTATSTLTLSAIAALLSAH